MIRRPAGASLAYTFDGSLLTSETWSGAITGSVAIAYDPDFRPVTETVGGSAPITTAYDADGYRTQTGSLILTRDLQNGALIGTSLSGVTTATSYSIFGEIDSTRALFNTTPLYRAVFQRDPLGRITFRTSEVLGAVTLESFTYDSAGRIAAVERNGVLEAAYEYDANGNRLSITIAGATAAATYDVQDRLLTEGDTRFEYSPAGDLIRRISGADTTTFAYNAWGILTSIRRPDGTVISYVLDGADRRVARRVNGGFSRGWLYQGSLAIVAEIDSTGAIVSRFAYGDRPNVPAYMLRDGQTYRLITDERGSVRLVVNAATGAVEQRLEYDVFGRLLLDSNPGFQPFGFAGGLHDPDAGLVHFGVRDYDPTIGRWLTRDPLLFEAGDPNLYRYANGDPVNRIDINGLVTAQMELEAERLKQNLNQQATRQVLKQRDKLMRSLCRQAAKLAGRFKDLERGGLFERHHVVAQADMRGLIGTAYTSSLAIAIPLMGGNWLRGSPHHLATLAQNQARRDGLDEIAIARAALAAAKCAPSDIEKIIETVRALDAYRNVIF
jgi:RHS repeat-associated protein